MSRSRRCTIAARRLATVVCLAIISGCLPKALKIAAVPGNLSASGGVGSISLVWSASPGATAYNVKRSTTSGGPYGQIATSGSPSYTDSSVVAGTTYYYVVSSVAPDGESANSAEVATMAASVPLTPTNLRAVAGDKQITLTWNISNGATSYHLKRSLTSGGPYSLIASPTAATFVDTALTNGTVYFYVVSAINVAGESTDSVQVSAAPDIQNPPPTTFGTWTNVTPAGVDLSSALCSNFGATSVQVDPAHPSNLYALFHCQGIWKSTDHGLTWVGPIDTGTTGQRDCSGGISIPPGSTAAVPTIYQACIRGNAQGFWRSSDGGVSWTQQPVTPTPARQDYYPPSVDPYDERHLVMAGHEFDSIVESIDGGDHWTSVPIAAGMVQNSRSPSIFFINTGNASTTRGTWLWIGDQAGGLNGTWRTATGGSQWVKVDGNEHVGNTQIYQPDASGVLYMTGAYSPLGNGVLRSRDYGQTWTHVGLDFNESVVFGTSKNVYAMFGGAPGNPFFQVASQPGTGTWVAPGTPALLNQGVAQVSVVNNGTSNILVGAMWNAGLWRYVEP
jgi:hypothetical protein